jgi:membrane protein implicated in regulation of membrane protease activity
LEWNAATVWWLAAGALVAVELVTGSFYLLMLALGAAAGAVAAHLGLSGAAQMAVAAVLGGSATGALYLKRSRQPAPEPSATNRDVNLDIGSPVHVAQWAGDGSARVVYRGASWAVRFAGSGHPHPGEHVIVALDGNELRVAPKARTN